MPPALSEFVQSTTELAPAAQQMPAWRWANAYYGALASRISQVMAGELSLDEAYERMNQDIQDQVEQASQ